MLKAAQSIWVFFVIDKKSGLESVPIITYADGTQGPAVAMDEQRALALRGSIGGLGREVRMVRFDERIDLDVLSPAHRHLVA